MKEIWLPESGFNGAPDGMSGYTHYRVSSHSAIIRQIAREYHVHYDTCAPFLQKLFNRNVNIILGDEAAESVEAAIYWHKDDNDIHSFGGTNHSLRICAAYNIPTFNVGIEYDRHKMQEFFA